MRFQQALDILQPLIDKGLATLDALRSTYGINREQPFPDRPIGACFGTLGQVCAFIGTPELLEKAEASFRCALTLFDDERDRERQWIYLGHLACDIGDKTRARRLWMEVCTALPTLSRHDFSKNLNNPYMLALALKGVLHFGEELPRISLDLPLSVLGLKEEELPEYHPYGLILQALAMICQRQGEEEGSSQHLELARRLYGGAARSMKGQGVLLQVLGVVTDMRAALIPGINNGLEAAIRRTFLELRSVVTAHFGDNVWGEDESGRPTGLWGQLDPGPGHAWEERARAALKFIRFNYC